MGGLWRADIAEEAEGPDEAVETDWGLAVEMPAMGSDLGVGHNPRPVRFREAQSFACAPFTPLVPFTPFTPLTPLCWVDAAERVDDEEVEEEVELSEEDEFDRCALLRGMSIRETSSALMLVKPLVGPLEPRHRFGGGATAVICNMWARMCPVRYCLYRSSLARWTCLCFFASRTLGVIGDESPRYSNNNDREGGYRYRTTLIEMREDLW